MKTFVIALSLFLGCGNLSPVLAQSGIDRDLLNEIYKIKAIDNHAHPLKYVAEGEKPDDEFDAKKPSPRSFSTRCFATRTTT